MILCERLSDHVFNCLLTPNHRHVETCMSKILFVRFIMKQESKRYGMKLIIDLLLHNYER